MPACEDEESPVQPVPSPFQEVIDQGATRYFGKTRVASQSEEEGVTTYEFDPASGPICLKGEPFRMSIRDAHSPGLFIFLQGGGACWSTFCLAINEAVSGIPKKLDILDATRPTNPLAGWSTVYLPYCDGSLFSGDSETDDDGDGKIDRRQRGLANLSAALDVAARRFPDPARIVLAGSSGGGYGTLLATLLVRAKFPGKEISVFNDAGIGLGKPEDPALIERIIDEFGARSLIPASCPDCTGRGHITQLAAWELSHDPQLRIAAFSSYEDFVISDVFLGTTPEAFRAALLTETDAVHQRYPDRYKRFFVNGAIHTTLLGGVDGLIGNNLGAVTLPPGLLQKLTKVELGGIDKTQVRGVTVATWFGAMLSGSSAWDDRLE